MKIYQRKYLQLLAVLLSLACCISSHAPLLLTKLRDDGQAKSAKNLSLVEGSFCDIPRSHSGFITVDKHVKNHLFFWLFPSKHNETTSPLVVWLHGGPAKSALLGLLWENGPLGIVDHQNGSVSCKRPTESWTDSVSMLYVDSPVGTGFSYTENNGYRVSLSEITKDLHEFLNQFYDFFPEYKSRQLFIGGEGYAGKFAISLAYRLHTIGIRVKNKVTPIPKLKGLYLNGPFFAPEIQMASALDLWFILGAISYKELLEHRKLVKTFFNKSVTDRNLYNRLMDSARPQRLTENFVKKQYLNYSLTDKLINAILKKHLHVGDKNYTFYSYEVAERLIPDYKKSLKDKFGIIMSHYKVLVGSGEFDALFSPAMVDFALMSTPWHLQQNLTNSSRSEWKLGGRLAGCYTQLDKFCRVVIKGAGHMTSLDLPNIVREMVTQFIYFDCVQSS